MQIFNTFMKIAKTKLGPCSIYLVIYVVLLSMMSNSGSKTESAYTDHHCKLAIFDEDQTEASKQLVDYLTDLNMIVEIEDDEDAILNSIYYQKLDYVLYIRKGYETTGELANIKRPGNTGSYVDSEISSFESCKKALLKAGYSEKVAYEKTLEALNSDGLISYHKKNAGATKPLSYYFFSFMPYVFLMACFQGVIPILVAFNKPEISDRTNVAPVNTKSKSVQIILGTFVFGIAILAFFCVVGSAMLGSALFTKMGALAILNAFIFMLIVVGIVNILGNFNLAEQSISMLSNIIGLGMSFLGGIFVPLEVFSKGVLAVSRFIPTYWYVQALEAIEDDLAFSKFAPYLGIELLYAVVFFALAMLAAKRMRMHRAA